MRTTATMLRGAVTIGLALAFAIAAAGPAAAVELGASCDNPDDGYRISLPDGWYYNERVEGGALNDIAACRFFSPQDFEVQAATDATGIAISIGREATAPRAEGTETMVDGRSATIVETVAPDDAFEPAGTRHYQYWIDMGADWLVADTSDAPNYIGDYDQNRATLDAMIDTLRFSAAKLPDTHIAIDDTGWIAVVGGIALLSCALAARRPAPDVTP